MTLRVEIIATLPLDEDQCERGLDARPIRQTWSGHDRLDGGHRGVNAVHPSEFLGDENPRPRRALERQTG